jgi:putative ABC transport system ATP-binding protein
LDLLRTCAGNLNATLVIATHDARVVQSMPHAGVLEFDAGVAVSA